MTNETRNNLPRVRPATDILEREDGFYVFMDMPGVAKEDLVIDLQENELTISGVAKVPGDESERYFEVQFGEGEYRRSLSISDIIDKEKIKASLENGVLELHMPKAAKVLPKRIDIQAG